MVIDVGLWGFDFLEVMYVVNYDLFDSIEDYVYWCGWIGWMGYFGIVIFFLILDCKIVDEFKEMLEVMD